MSVRLLLLLLVTTTLYSQNTVGTLLNEANADNGYTLFSPLGNTHSFLINNCGQVINSWQSNYFPGLSAYLHSDGTLFRSCRINNPQLPTSGLGGRIEQYSWTGNLLWGFNYTSTTYTSHHDFHIMPNGNILLLVAEKKTKLEAHNAGRDTSLLLDSELWTESVIELMPLGIDSAQVIWKWEAWDHLIQEHDTSSSNYGIINQHPEKVDINFTDGYNDKDWLHLNSIDYNPYLDQISLGSRNWSEIWIIDHSTSTQEASTGTGGLYGKGGDLLYRWGNPKSYQRGDSADQQFYNLHDVHWIEDSIPQLMVYNNGGTRGFSSVDIINLPIDTMNGYTTPLSSIVPFLPDSLDWSYQLSPQNSSNRLSSAQRLPNGGTIICSGMLGYFFEIDSTFQTTWAYKNPVAINGIFSQGSTVIGGITQVFNSIRYPRDFIGFMGKDMSASDPIELNFNLDFCITGLSDIARTNIDLHIFPNPASAEINIHANFLIWEYQIINLLGQVIMDKKIAPTQKLQINSTNLQSGTYLLKTNQQYISKLIINK